MLAKVYSAAVYGVDAYEVEIEVNAANGAPVIVVVGLPDVAVKESRDRVTTAIANSGYRTPKGRTTVNLAPADVKKEGPSFDLPIAVGMIATADEEGVPPMADYCLVGELALDGAVRPVNGVLPVTIEAKKRGRRFVIVPEENAAEAAVVKGITIYGVRSLRQVYEFLKGNETLAPVSATNFEDVKPEYEIDFADVKGQYAVKRAIEVAVAGDHNLLPLGPNVSLTAMAA